MHPPVLSDVSMSLLTGLVSSLMSLLVVLFITQFWKKILEPWYEEKLYKGPEISGAWQTNIKYSDGDENEISYYLKRRGVSVSGHAHCIQGISKGMRWKLSGTFENLILSLSYVSLDKTKLDKGSVTVMLIKNGTLLKGFINYYSELSHSIKSVSLDLSRSDEDANQ